MHNYDPALYHRRSIRLKNYDYSQPGAYFVTITTYKRELLFGEIIDSMVSLNQYGKIVQSCWEEIPRHFSYIQPDAFVVMPNHIHGVIVISDSTVGAQHAVPLLSIVIRSFKSAVTKRVNLLRGTHALPVWQRNYYEHIVRSDAELHQIREYIENNPIKWALDSENPDNLNRINHSPF